MFGWVMPFDENPCGGIGTYAESKLELLCIIGKRDAGSVGMYPGVVPDG